MVEKRKRGGKQREVIKQQGKGEQSPPVALSMNPTLYFVVRDGVVTVVGLRPRASPFFPPQKLQAVAHRAELLPQQR